MQHVRQQSELPAQQPKDQQAIEKQDQANDDNGKRRGFAAVDKAAHQSAVGGEYQQRDSRKR